MIEKIIMDYLENALNVPVYVMTPENPPQEYVLFEKTGSDRTNYIDRATVAFQSYSNTAYGASVLNEAVKSAVDSMVSLDSIGSVKLNSDYLFTDQVRKKPRYQALYDFVFYN